MKWRRQGHPQKIATKTTKKVVIFAITSSSFPEVWSPLLSPGEWIFGCFEEVSTWAGAFPGQAELPARRRPPLQIWPARRANQLSLNINPTLEKSLPAWTLPSSCNPQAVALVPTQWRPPPLPYPSLNYNFSHLIFLIRQYPKCHDPNYYHPISITIHHDQWSCILINPDHYCWN